MSGIKGKKREAIEEFSKKVGLGLFNVVAINPDTVEWEEILGFSLKEGQEEFDYTGESRDGNQTVRIEFWLKEDGEDSSPIKVVFFLEDSPRVNKDGTKSQYINDIGVCSWAEDEDGLPSWFMKREIRTARNGEEDLYNFLRTWLSLDYRDEETELMLNWGKLMRGDVSMLKEQIGGDLASVVGALATVVSKTKEDDDGNEVQVQYQGVYNRAFFPQYCMKHFRVKNYNDEITIASIQAREPKDLKLHEKFVQSVTGEYGCKDFYKLVPLEDYDPEENLTTTDDAMIPEGDNDASPDY